MVDDKHNLALLGARLAGLLQLRVLRFGLLQDGNIGIGIFPERKEILVRSFAPWPCRPAWRKRERGRGGPALPTES